MVQDAGRKLGLAIREKLGSDLSWPKNAIHEGFAQSATITQKGYPF